ncbi:MAG: methyltransferase domain-containing protein [Halothece sp.]
MNNTFNPEFWESRYQEGTDRWDIGKAAPAFVNFLASPETPPTGKTLVLGCGRGYDALVFAEKGHDVVGVDFAPTPIAQAREFAQQSNLSVEFLQQDIFTLPKDYQNCFDYVVEHTCFCTLPLEHRNAYIDLILSLLKPTGELIAVFFTHNREGGPPYGIQPSEILGLFTPQFEILQLDPVENSIPSRQGEEHFGRFRIKQGR